MRSIADLLNLLMLIIYQYIDTKELNITTFNLTLCISYFIIVDYLDDRENKTNFYNL